MKIQQHLWLLVLLTGTSSVWAYGSSSSSSQSCAKPTFTEFSPAENAQVVAGAEFSFIASANTLTHSLKVTAKNLPVNITISPRQSGSFEIRGKLPATIKNTYARIAVQAEGSGNCKGSGGWLVKIAD